MHNLLCYRFDHLMLEKIPKVKNTDALCQILSIRLAVNDLEKEKTFLLRLLDVVPLVENERQVILPLSPGLTLSLLAESNPEKSSRLESAPQPSRVELDFLSKNILTSMRLAHELCENQADKLTSTGSRRMIEVTSPAGMVLRFWQ